MNLHNRDIDHEEVLTATAGPAQFSDVWTKAAVVAQRRAWQRQCPCSTAQLWELDCLLHDCTEYCRTCKPNIDHLVNVLQLKNLRGLLNSETMGTCLCAPTGSTVLRCMNRRAPPRTMLLLLFLTRSFRRNAYVHTPES